MEVAKVVDVTADIAPFCELAKQMADLRMRIIRMSVNHMELTTSQIAMAEAIQHLENYIGYRASFVYQYGVIEDE